MNSSGSQRKIGEGRVHQKAIQRRLIPACEPTFCWGLHGGREWVVVGSTEGHISILSNGAAGASSHRKTFSLWQTIDLKEQISDEQGTSRRFKDKSKEEEKDAWKITALAWCKYPSIKLGEHPLDSDAKYCAGFAVGTLGRISIFYPSETNALEWELVSVLHPHGRVFCLSWAPEGHHLISGGSQIILWTPDSLQTVAQSMAESMAGSVGSVSTGVSLLEKNHQRMLMERSPMMAAVRSFDDATSIDSSHSIGAHSSQEKPALFDPSWVLDCKDGEVVQLADFSADGRMFATVAEMSVEVRVWFEGESLWGNLDYLSLYHPKAVVSARFRPRASASSLHVKSRGSHTPQSLITLCRDQKVRVWQESDPQTEELSFFVAVTIDTQSRITSVGWLQFINFFEGLRSPFPEHNSYSMDREDFMTGFHTRSPFFQASAHYATVWGQHQRKAAELRTGPIAQESRSSLDWIVAVDESGQVMMWSVEGLSDSPRRDIHCLPWSRSSRTIFKENLVNSSSNVVLRAAGDICHSKYLPTHKRCRSAGGALYLQRANSDDQSAFSQLAETSSPSPPPPPLLKSASSPSGLRIQTKVLAVEEDNQDDADLGQDGRIYGTPLLPVFVDLAATCRITQEFDPHVERDPWPSTSSFDINPKNIEVVSLSEYGLMYSFAEVDGENPDSPFGKLVHEDLCLAKAHTSEILRMTSESVVDLDRSYSPVEESFWVTSVDVRGLALTWPVRFGTSDEEVDGDALIRRSSLPLPRQGSTLFACCSEVEPGHLVAAIVSSYGSLELWERTGSFIGDLLARGGPPRWRRVEIMRRNVADSCSSLFVVRDAGYNVHIGMLHEGGDILSLYRASFVEKKVVVEHLADHTELHALCASGISDKQLIRHGALAVVACVDGTLRFLGSAGGKPTVVASFRAENHPVENPIMSLSNSSSGKILCVHKSNIVKVWQPGLCHLNFSIESIIDPSLDVGPCEIELAQSLYLGGGIDIVGVGVLEHVFDPSLGDTLIRKCPKVLIYSVVRGRGAAFPRKGAALSKYEIICSTAHILSGLHIRGIAWSGRDFGMAVASDVEMHLFQGWFRHPGSQKAGRELYKVRKSKELAGVSVAATTTMQLEAVNSIGDAAVGLQLPLQFHRPQAILEMLRAGWVEPVRKILMQVLKVLKKRKKQNDEMYDEDERPPAYAMVVKPPVFSLRKVLTDAKSGFLLKASEDQSNNTPQEEKQEQEPASSTGNNASALFDDDWAMGGSSSFSMFGSTASSSTTRGAASALFDEDPWESVLSSVGKDKTSVGQENANNAHSLQDDTDSELAELLTSYTIKALSSQEQLQLTAVAGVFDQVYGLDSDKGGFGSGVDERGSRFLLSYKVYRVSSRCLAPSDRPRSMTTADAAWAFDSDSQDALVSQCLPPGTSTWEDAKRIGVGLWLRNPTVARTLAEDMAKTVYQKSNRDPFSCALFYFALGKASVVSGLFRLVKNTKAAEMLANDFSEERWQTVATKNAFSLVKQQRWEHAAAFFILADKLQEATNIVVKNLQDYQLALFLCRVIEGESGPVQNRLWEHTVQPLGLSSGDPWLVSISNAALGEYERSIVAFVQEKNTFMNGLRQMALSESLTLEEDLESVFVDRDAILRVSKISKEALDVLERQSFPELTTSFNTLEPFYIRSILDDARRKSSYDRLARNLVTKRVLQESMQRAVSHFASFGIPLLSLFELDSIDSGLCASCTDHWRTKLSAQSFHTFVVSKHTCKLPKAGASVKSPRVSGAEDDDQGTDESESDCDNTQSDEDESGETHTEQPEQPEQDAKQLRLSSRDMVKSNAQVAQLSADLDTLLASIGQCSRLEVLESLWKVSRASNQVAIEFTILRMLNLKDGSFLVRLEQVMNSVMESFVSLGQSKIDAGPTCERHLLSGRRLASYAILFVDLCNSSEIVLEDAGMDLDEKVKLEKLLDMFARVALFCASFMMEQLELLRFLLTPDFPLHSVRKAALHLASSWFDYEELLSWPFRETAQVRIAGSSSVSSALSSQADPPRNSMSTLSRNTAGGDDAGKSEDLGGDEEDEEDDLQEWGIRYARKLMDVVVMRTMLLLLIQRRDEIAALRAEKQEKGEDFSTVMMESLLQACWPLNWTLLSDLQNCQIPPGMSQVGKERIESMKGNVFPDEDRRSLWEFVKGREQLRILTATAEWTGRSLDRERARYGCIPDPTVFCSRNTKTVFSEQGALLMSVDPINSLDGTIAIASERGVQVVRYRFCTDEEEDEEYAGSEDESGISSSKSMVYTRDGSDMLPPRPLTATGRPRGRSISDNRLPEVETGLVEANVTLSTDALLSDEEPNSASSTSTAGKERRKRSSPVNLLPRPRRPHLQLKRFASIKKRINKTTASKFQHAWSNSARSLLMVSKASDAVWWGEDIRMPLNSNLYGDSFVHSVSSHSRVKAFLRDGCATRKDWTIMDHNASVPAMRSMTPPPGSSGASLPRPQSAGTSSRRALLSKISSHHKGESAAKTVMHVESHPFLPFFATAGWDGSSSLFDAETEEPIAHFNKPGVGTPWKPGHGTRVRFSEDGVRLAGCDSVGQVLLWSLDACHDGEDDPFSYISCHTKRTLDCAFLNYNGTILATVGQSQHSENLCLWDLSLPPKSCRIAKVACCHNTAAYSVAHLQDEQVLLIGGGKGQLAVFDLRQRTLIMEEEHVHTKAIRSLAVHPSKGNYFGSGSTDGTVKLWTYHNGRPMSHAHLTGLHPTHTFMNGMTSDSLISQRGTTDLAFSTDFLFTCGADGKVKMTPLSSLMI